MHVIDFKTISFSELHLQALNGFLLVLSPNGEFVFISNSIEDLLGLKKVFIKNGPYSYTQYLFNIDLAKPKSRAPW